MNNLNNKKNMDNDYRNRYQTPLNMEDIDSDTEMIISSEEESMISYNNYIKPSDSSGDERSTSVNISIDEIMWNALMNNKVIVVSIIPLFIGYYLQDTIFTRTIAGVTSDVPGFVKDLDAKKLIIVLLPYLIALILFYISNIVSTKTMSRIELDAIHELTGKLIESLRTTKKQISVNDLILHIKKVASTKNVYNIFVTYIIPTFIVAIGLIYNFAQNDGSYSLIVIMILVAMMLITTKFEIDSVENAYNTEVSTNNLYDEVHEIMGNIDTVLTSNTIDKELTNVETVKDKTYELSCINELNNNNTTYGLQAMSIVAMLGINYLSYRLYATHKIDGPTFTSTVLLSLLFMDYYNYCIHAIGDLINSIGRYYETREYFKEFKIIKQSQKQINDQKTLKVPRGDIQFKHLTLKYENKTVFDNVDLFIGGGTVTGLLGPIGSGKTTLMKALAGITEYEGDIFVDGQSLKECSYESIVENIAYIPQHPKLFNRSIYYNINYGSTYTKDEIYKKLDKLGLTSFINTFQNKLDTIVGKEGSKLSGGQRQFVALIRAIIQNKSIFLLDEPSSSLDTTNKQIFMNLIKNIRGKTIIISTHDKQIMGLFHKIIHVYKLKKNNSNTQNDILFKEGRFKLKSSKQTHISDNDNESDDNLYEDIPSKSTNHARSYKQNTYEINMY
jgi:ATP-binding cassette subfamily C protein